MKKVSAPGRIYSRKLPKGNYLYYTIYNNKKRFASGLIDTPQNRAIIVKVQEKAYWDYLFKTERIKEEIEPNYYYINDLWNDYTKKELSQKQVNTIRSYNRAKILLLTHNYEINEKVAYHNIRISKVELMIKNNLDLLKTTLADNSINIQIRSIQAFLNWCNDNYYLNEPIKLNKYKIKVEQKKIVSYDNQVIELLMNELFNQDKEFYLYMLLMSHTGLRMSECVTLLWEQVNIEKNIIELRNKIKKHEYDTIPISNKVKEILILLKEITIHRGNKQEKVFRWEQSSCSRLTRRFNLILEKYNLKQKGTSFHGFRKMFLNKLSAMPNINLLDFQRVARIRDIKTAHNHYLQKENARIVSLLNELN